MALNPEKRILIERAVASFRQRLAAVHGKDAEWTKRYRSGDEAAIDDLIVGACEENGLPYQEYMDGLEDPQIAALHKRCITEVMLGGIGTPRG